MRHLVPRLALQIAVSAVFLGLLLWRVDVGRLAAEFGGADGRWLVLASGFFAASALLHGVRWWLLVRHAGPVPVRGGVLALIATSGVDLILPLHAGTAALFQVLHRRYGVERVAVVGTLGAEGLIDGVVLLLLALTVGPFLPFSPTPSPSVLLVIGLFLGVSAVMLVGRGRLGPVLARALPTRLRAPVARQLGYLVRSFRAFGDGRTVALLVLATLGDWGIAAVGHATVGRGFHLPVSVLAYVAVEVAGNLSSIMPLTQGNVGPYELVVHAVLVASGADRDRAAAFAVGAHATVLVTTLLTSVLAALALRLRWRDLFSLRQEREPV